MIITLDGYSGASVTSDVTVRAPRKLKIRTINVSGYGAVDAAATGGFTFISMLWRGSPLNRYGTNVGYVDDGLIVFHNHYISQGVANANLVVPIIRTIPECNLAINPNELLTLRVIGPATAAHAVIYTLYCD